MIKTIIDYPNGLKYELVEGYSLMQPFYNSAEPETKQWIGKHVKPDWTVFDLGAHIGVFTMLMSFKAGEGMVYAFEPCALTLSMLSANLSHNDGKWNHKFTNVRIIPTAVGNRSGLTEDEVLWFTDGTEQYGKTIGRYPMTTLDDFCIKHNMVSRLDFIKCDIDGWDYEALLGAEKTLQQFRPYLIVEVNYALEWRGHSQDDVAQFLEQIRYQHRTIDPTPGNWLCWPEEKSGG